MTLPIIRTSERRSLKRCPWRWWMGWREGLVPVGETFDALWFGTGVHIALAGWYVGPGLKRGPHPAETFKAWSDGEVRFIKQMNKFGDGASSITEEKLVNAVELGISMLEGYVGKYGRDDHWHVIQPEQTFSVTVSDPFDNVRAIARYVGTYDLVYRDLRDDSLILGEHKTAKAISKDFLPLDDQAGSYWAVAAQSLAAKGLVKKGERLQGIMYNFLRKSMPDTRPRNAAGYTTNKPQKADYISAINAERAKMPNKTGGSWVGPEPTGKESLALLGDIASKLGIEVFGEVSKNQPKPLFERELVWRTARERKQQIERIAGEAKLMEAYRSGDLPLIKNPTRDCQWDCDFYSMCLLHEGGHGWKEYRDSMFTVKDPYADHRKSTEE